MVKSIAGFRARFAQRRKNSISFNAIAAVASSVGLPTFVDFTLTKCDIRLLDSVKGAINGNEPNFQ